MEEEKLDKWFNGLSFLNKYKVIGVDYGHYKGQSKEEEDEITALFGDDWNKLPVYVKEDRYYSYKDSKYVKKYKWDSNIMTKNSAGAMVKTGGYVKVD